MWSSAGPRDLPSPFVSSLALPASISLHIRDGPELGPAQRHTRRWCWQPSSQQEKFLGCPFGATVGKSALFKVPYVGFCTPKNHCFCASPSSAEFLPVTLGPKEGSILSGLIWEDRS